ncbi:MULTISPECIES: NAD(P)-dependent oxidoreductase [unclassified Chelatococcus]|uniref:NAD(P)-dependent oxidoreductase n=1 Tax=unclassified Chelatococcus TaxID=2638111 RepID=UPI001BCEF0CC|nr:MULTISPECIES: NAD(P)-dependent oxidoreductase [unclassified Chelatococcus]MBS7700593.1 hydroxyacid dehydrogenase [Chelatococcus sp. YT9]MBX3558708.1 hydroxyacid dehydrogenase [Chelatococcus sp.]
MEWTSHQRERIQQGCPREIELVFLGAAPTDHNALARLDAVVVGTEPVSNTLLAAAPRLRLIQRWGTGLDNVDRDYARSQDIATAELPGVNARSVSEFILMVMLALLRQLPDVTVSWSRGRWETGRAGAPPRRLQGKTVGLIGFGAIGRDVARLLQSFDVAILYHDVIAADVAGLPARNAAKEELLGSADIISVQLPLTPTTLCAIGAPEIALMKRSAILISVSRAGVVDEAATRLAVAEGRLAAASFDNFAVEPLPADQIGYTPGILATPHIGGAAIEGFEALIAACFASITRHFSM